MSLSMLMGCYAARGAVVCSQVIGILSLSLADLDTPVRSFSCNFEVTGTYDPRPDTGSATVRSPPRGRCAPRAHGQWAHARQVYLHGSLPATHFHVF